MSSPSPLLSWGRGGTLLVAGGLLVSFATGWIRRPLLNVLSGPLMSLPWIPLQRIFLGVLFELPTALVIVILCAIAGRVLVLKPWITSLSLIAVVWLLDGIVSWLVLNDFGLWTDPLVAIPRVIVAAATAVTTAYVLGWRPRRAASTPPQPSPDSQIEKVEQEEEV